jgi:nucleotide-binding universal stress UspA family protein
VEYKIESNWGEMGSHLAFAASDIDADLLVLGTHQRKGVKRLLLGATLQPTLHAAIVPVLSVPGAAAVSSSAAIPAMSQVLVATDLSALGNGAIPYAYSLVEKGGVVHLLHVVERHLPNLMFSFDPNVGAPSGAAAKSQMETALRGLVPPGAGPRDIRTEVHVVEGGRVPTVILQTAERLGVDAVCVGSHGRGGLGKTLLGSVANVILEGSSKPVFVVRGARP